MSAVADRSEFFSLLGQSRLLEPPQVDELMASADLPADPGECAERLVQRGALTRFQAKQLLAGRFRGLVFGPYRLIEQIGKGGMGTVYLAEHAKLKRKVAIKVLARELAEDAAAVERFMREGRAASALCHPNVVRVHHAGSADGTHYLVMEYVDGATLEQVVDRKGPFAHAQAAKIGVQAAAGLEHAHEKGFVHRDIKPENLILTKGGAVKILDMGLTKDVTRQEDNLTAIVNPKLILGTIDYLSPEQATQRPVDARSDLYSLGATLFTLITGHSPYEGASARQKLLNHQSGTVPVLTAYRSEVPAGMAAVVAKMMAKNPADRFQTAGEVIRALTPWAAEDQGSQDHLVVVPSDILRVPGARPESLTPTTRDEAAETRTDLPRETPDATTPAEQPTPVPAAAVIGTPPVPRASRRGLWAAIAVAVVAAAGAAAWWLMG